MYIRKELSCWCRDGFIDKDIIKILGVSSSLFSQWKKEKVEFMEALKVGKEGSRIQCYTQ